MVDLSSLNASQFQAANWADGPLLVLAGPGSGKTRVLTYRIARMVDESPGRPFRLLGLTFTNKAAAEMRERIERLVPNAGDRIRLTTFHSFCVDILRQHGHHIGLEPNFTILSQAVDRESVLDEAIQDAGELFPDFALRGEQLMPMINRLLDDCVAPDRALHDLRHRNLGDAEALAAVYSSFRRLMVENNQLDFGSLIAEAIGLMEGNAAIRRLISRIYPYVCVDEFQDTNLAQYRVLVNVVDPTTRNLFVVADDDQMIYQWNGADPKRLLSLRDDFGVTVLQLPENYRCPAQVVDVANKLIRGNVTRIFEKSMLVAHKLEEADNVIRVEDFSSFEDEAAWVAADLAGRSVEERRNCVVLARTRRLLEPILDALETEDVPAYIAMRKDEFTSQQLIWLHSILRLANSRQDREQLRRICKSFFELAGANLQVRDIVADAAAADADYLRAWRRVASNRPGLDPATRELLTNGVPMISEQLDFWSFIQMALKWFDALPDVGPPDNDEDEFSEELDTWHELLAEVVGEIGRDQVTLNVLLQGLDLRAKTPRPPKEAVPCYTIHGAKGAEFQHVYLVGLVEDQLPSYWAVKKGPASQEIQEERRNCFVAITRAESSLTLTYSREVFGWKKAPSRFLKEMELVE